MAMQLEARLRETLERYKSGDQTFAAAAGGNSAGNSNHLEAMLQQLLSAARTQASRLAKLETSCLSSAGAGMGMNSKTGFQRPGDGRAGHQEQEVTLQEAALEAALAQLQQAKAVLEEGLRSSRQRYLPAGRISNFSSFSYLSNLCVILFLYLS